jgi:hypothetical protein
MNALPIRPFDFRKLLILFLAVTFFVSLMASIACCDEVSAARERLQAKESERVQAAELAEAQAKAALEAQAEALKAAAVPEPMPEPEPVRAPEPDPISFKAEPVIQFDTVMSAAPAERLPRGVLIVSQFCEPCIRLKQEVPDLIGGPDAPIQLVSNWLANDLDKWGITPGMLIATPTLLILDKDGKVHGLSAGGLGCVLRGYQTRATIEAYLTNKDHQVSLKTAEVPAVMATVEGGDISPEMFAAVMSAHLVRSSGQPETDDNVFTYGSLFDLNVDVPDSWKFMGAKLLAAQTIRFPSAGLTVDWSGPTRSFSVGTDKLTISPPVKVTLNKWLISYSAALDGIDFTPDLSQVTFLLTGAPDLKVNLK